MDSLVLNRRDFLRALLSSTVVAATVDVEKLLWIPGEKKIFIPSERQIKFLYSVDWGFGTPYHAYWSKGTWLGISREGQTPIYTKLQLHRNHPPNPKEPDKA